MTSAGGTVAFTMMLWLAAAILVSGVCLALLAERPGELRLHTPLADEAGAVAIRADRALSARPIMLVGSSLVPASAHLNPGLRHPDHYRRRAGSLQPGTGRNTTTDLRCCRTAEQPAFPGSASRASCWWRGRPADNPFSPRSGRRPARVDGPGRRRAGDGRPGRRRH